jgi:hypothetical protein
MDYPLPSTPLVLKYLSYFYIKIDHRLIKINKFMKQIKYILKLHYVIN